MALLSIIWIQVSLSVLPYTCQILVIGVQEAKQFTKFRNTAQATL